MKSSIYKFNKHAVSSYTKLSGMLEEVKFSFLLEGSS